MEAPSWGSAFPGQGHFDDAGLQERKNMPLVVQVGVGEAGAFEKLSLGFRAFGTSAEDFGDLLTDLRTGELMVGDLAEGGAQGGEQEFGEGGGVADLVAGGARLSERLAERVFGPVPTRRIRINAFVSGA